ncbi:MAG: ABC transporter ATP-binding protein [Planctomycetota bacterium]
MSAEAFNRAREYMAPQRGRVLLSQSLGLFAGALYAGWVILLVLFMQLLLDRGEVHVAGAKAELAAKLSGIPVVGDRFEAVDQGLLPVTIETSSKWYGFVFESMYRSFPWTHRNSPYLASLAVAAILIGAIRVLLLHGQHLLSAEVTTAALVRIQSAIFRQLFEMGRQEFEPGIRQSAATLLKRQVPVLHAGLARALDMRVRERVKVVTLLLLAIVLNPLLGLCFVVLAVLLWILGSWAVYRVFRRRRALSADADAQLNRILGLASKLRLIKGYAAEDYFQGRYDQHLSRYREDIQRRLAYEGRIVTVWQFLGLILAMILIMLGAWNVLSDRFTLSSAVGVYVSLVSVILPIYLLLRCRETVRRAGAAAREVFDFLDQTPRSDQKEGTRFLHPLSESIEFDRVSFKNSLGDKVIDDVSVRIKAGQRVALVGRSETEIRAFVYLLTRFIDPTKGKVRIDGIDVKDVTFESLRSQSCMVLQGDLLFPDTVTNNIGCGDPGFTLQKVIEAAKIAHAHHFVQRLPHGYECVVGEEGFPLKLGESYRIALARAILRDPPLVILEEPREALDDDTKSMLDDTMSRFCRDRTVIVIPHRISTLRTCDQVLLFDGGQIQAVGTHRELLEASELYRHLQYTEFHHAPASAK